MRRDRVVIAVVTVTVVFAILFGVLMAYRTYKLPMRVDNFDDTILTIKGRSNDDDIFLLERLEMLKELSRSCKMRDNKTGEIRKFSKKEIEDIYNEMGGKERVIKYLNSIEDEKEKIEKTSFAFEKLQIITVEELKEILDK